jgi:hypothetical protein
MRWFILAVLVVSGAAVGIAIGQDGSAQVGSPIASKTHGPTQTTRVAVADGATAPGLTDPIPAQILGPDTPPPFGKGVIAVSNAWEVSDGSSLVAVYAGSSGPDPSNGIFVIVRESFPAGRQTITSVAIPGSGAATITNAPTGITNAQASDIPFITETGAKGALHLSNDTETLG